MTERNGRPPLLRLVGSDGDAAPAVPEPTARDTDWAILMAHAQDGDRSAYQRLLQEITPYLRSLAARRHRDPSDIEDAVQAIRSVARDDREPAVHRPAPTAGAQAQPGNPADARA